MILLLVALFITMALCAQSKKVAVMETKTSEGVSSFQSNMVRGGMEAAVAMPTDRKAMTVPHSI